MKKRDAPGTPAVVWTLVGSFCAIRDWHPEVADCVETKEGDATFRSLTLKDGAKIKEQLLESDDTSYSYAIIESPLPVKNYKATLSVEEDEDSPDRSEIHWDATFDAQGVSDEDAKKKIADIFEAGVAGMKRVHSTLKPRTKLPPAQKPLDDAQATRGRLSLASSDSGTSGSGLP
jgi:hypothetical protein